MVLALLIMVLAGAGYVLSPAKVIDRDRQPAAEATEKLRRDGTLRPAPPSKGTMLAAGKLAPRPLKPSPP